MAVKVLPEGVAPESDARRSFAAEARTISALNDPHFRTSVPNGRPTAGRPRGDAAIGGDEALRGLPSPLFSIRPLALLPAGPQEPLRVPGPAQDWKSVPPEKVTDFSGVDLYIEHPKISRDGARLFYTRGRRAGDIFILRLPRR